MGLLGGKMSALGFPSLGAYLDPPKLPSNIPQISTIKGHKDSIKGPLRGPGRASGLGHSSPYSCLRYVGLLPRKCPTNVQGLKINSEA